jgi:rod shape-determining protein MreD
MSRHLVAVILLGFLALTIKSVLVSEFSVHLIPDAVFLLVIISAKHLKSWTGLLVAFLLGYMTDVFSESPAGHHACLRLISFYLTTTFYNQFQLDRTFVFVPFVFTLSLLDSIGAWVLMNLIGMKAGLTLYGLGGLLLSAIVNAVFAPILKRAYGFLMRVFRKENRTRTVRFSADSH